MNRSLALLALAVLVAAGLELGVLHTLKPLENRLLDGFVKRQAAKLAPDPDLVLVEIDEKSLARMEEEGAGRFPWPRSVYAEIVEGIEAQKPRAIVFDIMFFEKDEHRRRSDKAFVDTASRYRNIYYPLVRLDAKDKGRQGRTLLVLPLCGSCGAAELTPIGEAWWSM